MIIFLLLHTLSSGLTIVLLDILVLGFLNSIWDSNQFSLHQAPLSLTVSQSLLKFMSIELVLLSNHLILCLPLLLLPSVLHSIRVFSSESALRIRWPEYYFRVLPSRCCSVAKSCLILCDPTDRSTPGSPVHPYHLELAQTHVH